jgi:hypothetical protein
MTGDDQTSEVDAVRGRLIERVHDQIRKATEMTDMRATERLLQVIEEPSDDPKLGEWLGWEPGDDLQFELLTVLAEAAQRRLREAYSAVGQRPRHARACFPNHPRLLSDGGLPGSFAS